MVVCPALAAIMAAQWSAMAVATGGTRHQGRWVGGHRAPGGWNSYRRLGRGYSLPRYWQNQAFYIPNYSYYGFTQPAYGYTLDPLL